MKPSITEFHGSWRVRTTIVFEVLRFKNKFASLPARPTRVWLLQLLAFFAGAAGHADELFYFFEEGNILLVIWPLALGKVSNGRIRPTYVTRVAVTFIVRKSRRNLVQELLAITAWCVSFLSLLLSRFDLVTVVIWEASHALWAATAPRTWVNEVAKTRPRSPKVVFVSEHISRLLLGLLRCCTLVIRVIVRAGVVLTVPTLRKRTRGVAAMWRLFHEVKHLLLFSTVGYQ